MSDPRPPSIGSTRCMIYKPKQRVLSDGCDRCGLSLAACAATRDIQREACCEVCAHDH